MSIAPFGYGRVCPKSSHARVSLNVNVRAVLYVGARCVTVRHSYLLSTRRQFRVVEVAFNDIAQSTFRSKHT